MTTTETNAVGNTTDYQYNSKLLLEKMTDSAGEKTSYTYDSLNRLKTVKDGLGTISYTYDAKGNMTYGPVDGTMQELTYDCRNRLTEAGGVSYTYDAENTRTATEKDGRITEYVTDTGGSMSRLLTAYEADGTQTEYYYGAEGLAAQYNNGTKEYLNYHYDNIGSTTMVTDAAGNIIEKFAYGTYGELLSNGKNKIRFLYNGAYGVATDENGLYYMRARYYNSDIKRFINQDIKVGDIGSSQSLNRYAYCEGNPVSLVDPFGLSPESTQDQGKESKYQTLHNILDIAGFVFDVADIVNAAIYAAEGDWGNAALCAVAVIPLAGSVISGVVKGAKAVIKAKKAAKIASLATEASQMTKKAAKTLDTITDTMKTASKWGDNLLKLADGITAEAGSKAMKALETGGDFAKESNKAVWEMKAVVGADGVRLSTSAETSASLLKNGFARTDSVAKGAKSARKSGSKTNFDNEIPRSGSEWNEYLKGKYGADNVHWNINSVDDIFSDPTCLKGYTADELQKALGNDWTRGVYGSNGGGWKLMNGDISIFYHPGGGKHGGSYYGISSGATGKIKVVNPETYIPLLLCQDLVQIKMRSFAC